jgi:uncharacterized membrane protein
MNIRNTLSNKIVKRAAVVVVPPVLIYLSAPVLLFLLTIMVQITVGLTIISGFATVLYGYGVAVVRVWGSDNE